MTKYRTSVSMTAYRYLQKYYDTNLYSTAFTIANSDYSDKTISYAIVATFNENGYDFSINSTKSEIQKDIDDAKLYVYQKDSMLNGQNITIMKDENGKEIGHFETLGFLKNKDSNGNVTIPSAKYYFSKQINDWYRFHTDRHYVNYFDEDVPIRGWQLINNNLYYFDVSGAILSNATYELKKSYDDENEKQKYTFDADGKLIEINDAEISEAIKLVSNTNEEYCYNVNEKKWSLC